MAPLKDIQGQFTNIKEILDQIKTAKHDENNKRQQQQQATTSS